MMYADNYPKNIFRPNGGCCIFMFEGTVVWKAKFDASMRKDIKIVNKKSVSA